MERVGGKEHAAPALLFGACVSGLMVALGVGLPPTTEALPPGKGWSAVTDSFKIPGHTYGVIPWRLEADALGHLIAFVEAQGGIGQDMYVLRWQDATWASVTHLGYGTKGVRPVPSPPGTYHLVWSGLEEIEPEQHSYLVMSSLQGNTLGTPDTVTTIWAGALKYAAAAGPERRWAAAADLNELKLFYSLEPGIWTGVQTGARGNNGVAVSALNDSSALVAWRDRVQGPGAGILSGSTWTIIMPPPMTSPLDGVPQLRPRASGGHWLSWATIDDYVGVSSYRDGAWSPPDSISCAYLRPEHHYSQSPAAMSRDDEEYPAISWMAVSSKNGLTSVCVCVPGETGFTVAENLPGSEEGGSPVVARDGNKDIWVVWEGVSGMAWAHTYTSATTSPPTVTGHASERAVSWTLSEPAPGSWWAVLRSKDAEPLEEVARLRAGAGLAMNWTDTNPSLDTLHYRIRRECADKQYELLSEEGTWTTGVPPSAPNGGRLLLVRASSNPAQINVRFEVLNAAAGALETSVYDVRGRLILWQKATASGSGRDFIQLDPGSASAPIVAGLYFLQVRDAAGRVSASARFVYLR